MIQFQALGGLSVTHDGEEIAVGGRRQRRLLAMLLIHRNAVVSVDRLADVVFDGEPTPAAATTLRSYVARIRKVVEVDGSASGVVTKAPGYMLRVPSELFDVARFEQLVSEGRSRLGRDDSAAATGLRHALGLCRGGAYAEFDDEDWVRPEAQRVAELRLVALESLFDAELACGRSAELVPEIEALVAEQPLREAPRRQLMTALYRSGRQPDALRQFADYRAVLIDELGLDPTPSLRELESRILAHDDALTPAVSGHPLRGYRLGERLGTGRDGTVHAARLAGVDREYVIQTLRQEIADAPDFVRDFEATARRVAALDHPAIVHIHDYWREPGAAYVVMQRVHGGTLADRLARGPMTRQQLSNVVDRVGGALVAAAAAGVLHGRVTSKSVVFDDNGDACLTDFALGQPDRMRTLAADASDLAALVASALPDELRHDDATSTTLARARSTDPMPIGVLVNRLGEALSSEAPTRAEQLVNPYKGLRAFDETDAADFFGRQAVVDEMLARLARNDLRGRLVLVVAGSGTGKSSVVRAGLLPRIRRGDVGDSARWYVTTMLPGGAPFKELAESLRRVAVADINGLTDELAAPGGIDRVLRRLLPDAGQLLLVIDQLEELFTLTAEREQRAFVDRLMDAVTAPDSRLRVVATLRADFYDRPLAFQGLGPAVQESTVTVPAMSPAELEAAIVEPAARAGRRVEGALVAELVSAVGDEPGALPSLQFALYELAEACDRDLTLAAYRQLGGVQGAIAARAESLYCSLDDPEREVVRGLFEQLVVIEADAEPTRRPVSRTDVTGSPSVAAIDPVIDGLIDRWIEARLLTGDRDPQTRVPTVEVAHEALLREWPRLRAWIEEDRDELTVLGHLRDSAVSWVAVDRDPGAVYRGARLQAALDVAERRPQLLSRATREFLDESRVARDRELQDRVDQLTRQARSNRRLRIQLVAIAIALVVALAGGFVAVRQRREADLQRRVATARELAAAADANLSDDPQLSILLALQAINASRKGDGTVLTEATDALHGAITSSRIVREFPHLGGSLDWSPDGRVFVTEGPEDSGLIAIRDASTGEVVRSWHGHDVDINDVVFGPDGTLATAGDDGALRVWKTATGSLVDEFAIPDSGSVWSPAISPDGSKVAAAWVDQSAVRVYDIASGKQLAQVASPHPFGVSFNNDGSLVAFGDETGPVTTIAEAATGKVIEKLGSGDGSIWDVAFSPDGTRVASTGADTNVRIWDVASGDLLDTIAAHHGGVENLDWSDDGTRLATASDDGTARVFDVGNGAGRQLVSVADAETREGIQSVAFSPDGNRIMTGDGSMTAVKIWDVSPEAGAEWLSVAIAPASPGGGFVDGGRAVVASDGNGTAAAWQLASGKQVRRFVPSAPRGEGRGGVALSADGSAVAASGDPGYPVVAWDTTTGAQLFTYSPGDSDMVMGLQWSPDGQRLAVAETPAGGGRITILDRSCNVVATLRNDANVFTDAMAFTPDDRLLVAHLIRDALPGATRIWDIATKRTIRYLPTSAQAITVDPTGTWIVTSGQPSTDLVVWDAAGLKQIRTISTPAVVMAIAYSPDGKRLAAAGIDGVVRVWDTATWTPRASLRGHSTFVRSVAFSPDGS